MCFSRTTVPTMPLLHAVAGVGSRLPPTPLRKAGRWEKWQGTSQSRAWLAPDRQEALLSDPCVLFALYPSLSRPTQTDSRCVLCDDALLPLVALVQAIDRHPACALLGQPPVRVQAIPSGHISRSIRYRPGHHTVVGIRSSQE